MDEERQLQQRIEASSHNRPSIMIEQPTYSFDDDDVTTTMRQGDDNPFHDDVSSYGDNDYSGSDLEEEEEEDLDEEDSFAVSEVSDGILSPEEIDKQEKQIIALKEHLRVFRARIFVIVLLMITAITNSVLCYFVTRNQEKDDYAFHYTELTNEVRQSTQENVRIAFQSLGALSRALTTLVLDDWDQSGNYWPFATFPHFPALAADIRNVSGAIQVTFVPIVREREREQWEQYSVERQGWLLEEEHTEYYRHRALLQKSASNSSARTPVERIRKQQQSSSSSTPFISKADPIEYDLTLRYPPPESNRYPSPPPPVSNQRTLHEGHNLRGVVSVRIHPAPTREEKRDLEREYAPVWQMSPPPYYRGIVLHDLYREPSFQRLSETVIDSRQGIVSNLLDDDLVELLMEQYNAQENLFDGSYQPIYHSHGKRYPPTSVVIQPVWDDLEINNPDLAGYLVALIPWEAYIGNTIRPDSDESVLAQFLEFDCDSNEMLNYLHKGGDDVEYLGEEDDFKGKSSFDFSMESEMLFPLRPPPSTKDSQLLVAEAPTMAPSYIIDPNPSRDEPQPTDCKIGVKLYPSYELRDLYLTPWPIYYSLMVFAVFLVLSISFFIYDLIVEKRRGKAMMVAEKTGRIVTKLFPGQFADQLIAENKQKEKDAKKQRKKSKKKKKIIKEAPNRRLKKFMDNKPMSDQSSMQDSSRLNNGPISPDASAENPLFLSQSKPIADLFPDSTVLFADIVGFTAWSSVREPSQVFTLLETVYQNFDFLAKQYGIFKIETIGDCYVAVCGLPEARADHAPAMCRFAMACMQKMKSSVSMLETTLGPDTGDLTMRFGIHSGPVTAGVLRGERARFQLFGDTVNTAARMESTGMRDKIQISQETADLLTAAGKTTWFVKRDELVKAKGKGELQTYFLTSNVVSKRGSVGMGSAGGIRRRHSVGGGMSQRRDSLGSNIPAAKPDASNMHNSTMITSSDFNVRTSGVRNAPAEHTKLPLDVQLTKKQERLVDWNVEMLQQIIRQIVARRNFTKNASRAITMPFTAIKELPKIGGMMIKEGQSTMPLDEVVEVINLPEFDVAAYHATSDARRVKLDPLAVAQLRRFVALLASKYRDNPFHNFDHASHVAMSVNKLLSRIIAPDLASINARHDNNDLTSSIHLTNDMKDLHDHTYGITSDPLTQLAVVVSALVHDVDHPGVPNNILIKENPEMALKYRNKSVAEQNSVDIAWQIFMDDEFKALRDTICPEYTELRRFRQIIVSSVLATDIFDPELSSLRKARWAKAFPPAPQPSDAITPGGINRRTSFNQIAITAMQANTRHEINRKATIVIEHLIQASDVSHTMQHWHIYQKWNECLFKENYEAYTLGRSDKDPSEGWYKGELWFFDNYIIPLAKKLKECGVFGVSSDEYLDYAVANREEWRIKGEEIVKEMLAKYKDARGPIDPANLGYE